MCRNITTLRGLEPAATAEEIEAAAAQFVRKVTGVAPTAAPASRLPAEEATTEIAAIITRLLDKLPARKVPPKSLPPLRRPEVQARIAERMRLREEHERMHELGIAHTH
jgi:hypothetical protein